jgi:hypothetical protein
VLKALIYALCQSGELAHHRFGMPGKRGCIRIPEKDLDEFQLLCRTVAAEPPEAGELRHVR